MFKIRKLKKIVEFEISFDFNFFGTHTFFPAKSLVSSCTYHYNLQPVERVKQETVEEGEDVALEEGDGGEVSGDKCNECI